jgi:signal transduction histidine kinase/ABC-type multidrug transport system ATPase subunit
MAIVVSEPLPAYPSVSLPLLTVERLGVRFGSFQALDDVDFEIRPGEAVALAGENGAGKSTLVRCIAGDIAPTSGQLFISGERITANPAAVSRHGVAVVWQDLALCENLDVASNLLLGHEDRGQLRSDTRFYAAAAALLESLGIPHYDTTRSVRSLSAGQRQLIAVARAMSQQPRLLILDEPTSSLGVAESAQVEQLTANIRKQGTTVLLVSHDVDQMFRLADRIAVLRHGRLVAEVDPARSHPDDVVALITGQQTDSSARRQLSRLHSLADRLATADSSSSLPLIRSALAAALGTARICIHLVDGTKLQSTSDLGLPHQLMQEWAELPFGADGGPVGLAAATEEVVVDYDIRSSPAWARWRTQAAEAHLGSSFAVPVIGTDGLAGVITVFRRALGHPPRDELDLVTLYAGFAASAVERERLLDAVTARNRVLETIQEVLETLAGPIPLGQGLRVVLRALCQGLQADAVGLLSHDRSADPGEAWVLVDAAGDQQPPPPGFQKAASSMLSDERRDGKARRMGGAAGGSYLGVTFAAPSGVGVLIAHWATPVPLEDATALLEDAANSMRLAHERQEAERARQEATALRRSQELQRDFLSRLSHELRTPLTAIRGFASSLMQSDVTWDGESEKRFLSRIGDESARLNRLVDDLLDFSAIESSTLRLQWDWCDVALVLDAAVACVVPSSAATVDLSCAPDLPIVWADHDRLEQVFVNLLDNALRHNPAGTRVWVEAKGDGHGGAIVSVTDDGSGVPEEITGTLFHLRQRRRSATAGAGLGLSIAKGIVDAHGGWIQFEQLAQGTRFTIHLPVDGTDAAERDDEERDLEVV